MASGAPPRMTVANAAPSSSDQRQRPVFTIRWTAISIHGMAAKPSVMSMWFTWLNTVPAKVKVSADKKHATTDSFRTRR